MATPSQILYKYWGFNSFKPMQEQIISSVLDGKDTFVLLPTGGGKSICFQVPALILEGICIVISPLVALMTDQVNQLKSKGIKAMTITGGIGFKELQTLLNNAIYGNYKFLYLSPERLKQEIVQNHIKLMNVNLIAIDEAHCISQWGHDFRPAYKEVVLLRKLKPLAPTISLTATATPEVLSDTISQLQLELPIIYKTSFFRKNLAYQVFKEEDKIYRIKQLIENSKAATIIYVRNRKLAVDMSKQLQEFQISSAFYHGGIQAEEKKQKLEDWMQDNIQVMVATNAFGMGIDKPNVKYVIHIQLPESLESYFQEAGRAGRDGNYAQAIILYSDYDIHLIKKQYLDTLPSIKELKKIYRSLSNYFQIPYGEGQFTEHSFNFTDFCTRYNFNFLLVYNALTTLDRLGILQLSKQFNRKSILQFIIPSENLLLYFKKNTLHSIIGKTILRLYGGIFEVPTSINLDLISSKTGQTIQKIIETLEMLKKDEVISLTLYNTDTSIVFLVPREDDKTINLIAKEVKKNQLKKENEIASVIQYINNNSLCKSIQLTQYFGEENAVSCGICSVCSSQKNSTSKNEKILIAEKILQVLEAQNLNSRKISEILTFPESKIIIILQLLQDSGKIKINTKNQYYLI